MTRTRRAIATLAVVAMLGTMTGCKTARAVGGLMRTTVRVADAGVSLGFKAAKGTRQLAFQQVEHGFRAAEMTIDTVDAVGTAAHRAKMRRLAREQRELALARRTDDTAP